jgi:ribosomal protein L29
MATEGHRQGQSGDQKKMSQEEMGKELNDMQEELSQLKLQWKNMQQEPQMAHEEERKVVYSIVGFQKAGTGV